jgi:6-phosphogluconolactonase
LAVDPIGEFLYAGNFDTVSGFKIEENGALSPLPSSPFAARPLTELLTVDLVRNILFATSTTDIGFPPSAIRAYRIDASGALSAISDFPFPEKVGSTAIDQLRQTLYAPSGTLWAFHIGTNGAIAPIPGSPFKVGSAPVSVAIVPPFGPGKFVYVANIGDSTISAFRIRKNGTLTPVPGTPFPSGPAPAALAADFFGHFLYSVNRNANNISGYHINRNGSLSAVPGSPFQTGATPTAVAISP